VLNALGRRLFIGFTAGVLAGFADFYLGLAVKPYFGIFEHYKFLALIVFLSTGIYVIPGVLLSCLYHLVKYSRIIKRRTLFPNPYVTVLGLSIVLILSLRLLLYTKSYYVLYGSAKSIFIIGLVLIAVFPLTYGLNRLVLFVIGFLKRHDFVPRRIIIVIYVVMVSIPVAVSAYFFIPDALNNEAKNLICFVLIDALRADHCSCYGYGRNTTPEIDSIAKRGTTFVNCQSQAPWTKPSVATIFTGLPPAGHKTNRLFDSLPGEAVTLAETLRSEGYITYADSANYHITPRFGFDQGFDFFATDSTPVTLTDGPLGTVVFDKIFRYMRGAGGQEPALYAIRRTAFILRYFNNEPVFLYMHLMEPHEPYTPAKRFKNAFGPPVDSVKFRPNRVHMEVEFINDPELTLDLTESEVKELMRRYDCEILQCDYAVGELFNELGHDGGLGESLIIITSDHGEEFMEHGFLYHARALYRESLHVPLIIVNGRKNDAIPVIPEPVALADLTPTIYDWAAVSPPANVYEDFYGRSLLPAMSGKRLESTRKLVSEIDRDVFSSGSHDLSKAGKPVGYISAESVIGPDYKLIRDRNRNREFIFDVKNDPTEQKPLAEKPRETTELEKILSDVLEYYKERHLKPEKGVIDEESWRKMRDMGYVH
jgi:arylsulfatase A-like enzyme